MIVHYRNTATRVQCDIELPDEHKTGLASFLSDGATLTSPYATRADEREVFPIVERNRVTFEKAA